MIGLELGASEVHAWQPRPDVFLSYTHFDDRDGRVNEFRRLLGETVQGVTGNPFAIFKDKDGIGIGEHWSDKLDQTLNGRGSSSRSLRRAT